MTAAPEYRVWQGIEACHPPMMRRDYPDLLAMAERMLEAREKAFPARVAAGELASDQAERQLRIFRDLVADWRFIAGTEGAPASAACLHSRREALDDSLRTIAALAAERGGFDAELAHSAHCVIALRWHAEEARTTILDTRLVREFRARNSQNIAA